MATQQFSPIPPAPAPSTNVGLIGWLKQNLFSNVFNSVLTLIGIGLLALVLPPLIQWAFLDAVWSAVDASECKASGEGACWAFVGARFNQFMFGLYPEAHQWRILLALVLLPLTLMLLLIKSIPAKYTGFAIFLLYPLIAWKLFAGGIFGMEVVETARWGGLFLTLVIAGVGITASFPLGILLALGRRSDMPIVKSVCIGFIELIRGVPLISILFMASVMLPLFLPEGVNFNKLMRAIIGVTLFQAAYMAEVIRGGLQAIPRGQYEAADALGLSFWEKMNLIVLPQALVLVIPGIVNSFIALFKDTTLVAIIGMFDFLGIVQSATQDPDWLGMTTEGYVFCAVVYWIFCFSMSRYSLHLENKLHTSKSH